MTTTAPALDQARLDAFMARAIGDFAGTMTTISCILGDRLGLFAALAQEGPATSDELAERAGVEERYVREWLHGLRAAGYLEYDRDTGRFALPPEHAQALAVEGGPMFLCGGYQELQGAVGVLDRVTEAFRAGGGVPQEAYGADLWDGMRRFTSGWFDNLLLQQWIPAIPGLRERLESGADFADVGCGAGAAVIKLAKAFPASRFTGYDAFEGQLARARAAADHAGVADRVRFEALDAAAGLPARHDVISTFDVVHDAIDPLGLLRAIRTALPDDGLYLLLDINCADRHEDNDGPLAAIFYGFSLLYCMPTSLAHGGAGLGTCGLPPGTARRLCEQAGFSHVRPLPLENPFNVLYEVRP